MNYRGNGRGIRRDVTPLDERGSSWISSVMLKEKETGEPTLQLILPNGRKGEMRDDGMKDTSYPASLRVRLLLCEMRSTAAGFTRCSERIK